MHAVFTHPFKAGEPGLAFSDCIMLLEQLKARRKNEVHTSWRPASIEPLLRSGFSKGTSVCTKFDRAFPLNLAMTSCSARRVAISPLPRTNDSTHLNLLQHIKPSLAISSTSTTLLMRFLFLCKVGEASLDSCAAESRDAAASCCGTALCGVGQSL